MNVLQMKPTTAWKALAADMIEAQRVTLDNKSSDDDLYAADFIWTEGILMWPREQQLEVVAILREPSK